MSKQTINIGASPNDGTGTPLRTSFDYTNQNFTELYTALGGGVGLPGATTQVIFNDGGTNLAGDSGLTFNKTTDTLSTARITASGDAIVCSSTGDFYVGTTISPQFKVERATGNATITGNLTVDTSTLFVDSSNDRVGIGTATPAAKLIVRDGSNRNLLISSDASQLGSAGIAIGSFTDNAAAYAPLSIIAGTSMGFGLNGTIAMTLNSTGLLVGTALSGGSISNGVQILAGIFSTLIGSLPSVATATPTTIFAAPSESTLMVTAYVLGAAPSDYKVVAVVKVGGGVVAITTLSSATSITITASGTNIQVTQTSGGSQNVGFNVLRLA